MARRLPRGIKQRHPLGSVASRTGVSPLTVVAVQTSSTGVKISELPAASAASDTDQLEVNQGGTSRRITVDQLLDVTGGAYLPLAGGEVTGTVYVTTEPASWSALATQFSALESNIGDLPPEAQFGAGTTPVVHAVAGLIDIPSSSAPPSYGNGSGVSGYARTANTQYAGVGVIGGGLAGAADTSAWGANLAVVNTAEMGDITGTNQTGAGFDNVNLYGVEIDIGVFKVGASAPGGNMRAIYIIGASETLTTGSSVAVWVDSPGYTQVPRLKWNSAYYTEDASAVLALDIGATGVGNAVGSQLIQLRGRDAGGITRTATLSTDGNGALFIAPTTGQATTIPIVNLTATGQLNINDGKVLDGDGSGVGYNKLYDGSANTCILMGGSGDTTNYYRNGTHKLQDRSGATDYLTVSSSGVTARPGTAIAAGANTQAFIKASSTANLGLYFGSGNPSFSAAKGSIYTKTDATTTTTRLWVNTDGSTTWTNLTTAA